jgi:hypothetical protein
MTFLTEKARIMLSRKFKKRKVLEIWRKLKRK